MEGADSSFAGNRLPNRSQIGNSLSTYIQVMAAPVHISDAMIAQATVSSSFNPWRRTAPSRLGWAGLLSLVLHGAIGVAVMSVVVRAPEIAVPIRVMLYDPPPPPPPAMNAVTALMPSPVQVVPERRETTRVTELARNSVARIRRRSVPIVPPQPVEVAPSPEDVAIGQPGGVAGGVAGGVGGGVVGGTGHALLSAEEASVQPVPISKVMPEYPPVARLRGIEGQVVLEAILAIDGHVEPDITVVQSVPLLDNAAVAALRQWRFRPARNRDGEALRVTFRVPVRFQLR